MILDRVSFSSIFTSISARASGSDIRIMFDIKSYKKDNNLINQFYAFFCADNGPNLLESVPKMTEFEVRKRIVTISEMERIKRGKSIRQWCDLIGIAPSSYKRSVNLEKEKFDLIKLMRLADVTGYSLDDLCGRTHKKTKLNNYQRELAEAVYDYICELKKERK